MTCIWNINWFCFGLSEDFCLQIITKVYCQTSILSSSDTISGAISNTLNIWTIHCFVYIKGLNTKLLIILPPFIVLYKFMIVKGKIWIIPWKLHHILETLPYPGNFTISWKLYHILDTLPYPGNFTIPWKLCHILATLPFPGNFTISWKLYDTLKTLPYLRNFAISWKLFHILETLWYLENFTIS